MWREGLGWQLPEPARVRCGGSGWPSRDTGTGSSPRNELCGHFISLAICEMGAYLALPSSRGTCGRRGWLKRSLRLYPNTSSHPKGHYVVEASWGSGVAGDKVGDGTFVPSCGEFVWEEDVQKFSTGGLYSLICEMRVILESSQLAM